MTLQRGSCRGAKSEDNGMYQVVGNSAIPMRQPVTIQRSIWPSLAP